jgi:primosomal protein N'
MLGETTPADIDTPVDAETIARVASEIKASGLPKPLSEDERIAFQIDWEIRQEQARQRDEQQRVENARRRAEAAEVARLETDVANAQAREKARLELRERADRQAREREIADLRIKAMAAQGWMTNVERAVQNAEVQRQRQALIDDLERSINPPPPAPELEPKVVVISENDFGSSHLGDSDFNPELLKRPGAWRR